jgi:serine/threonine protein kinase
MNEKPSRGKVEEMTPPPRLPVRFRRDAAELARANPGRGLMRTKHSRAYYLDGLTAVFQSCVNLPGTLRVDEKFSGAEVVLLNPGPNAVEILGILDRFPEIKCLHIIESSEQTIDAVRAALETEAGGRSLPEMIGYVTDVRHLPEELMGRCDLVVEINVVDPKADKLFRQDVARQISQLLKLGGLFYSAGVTVRWTDKVIPLSLVPISIRAKILKQAGYSDALPRPVFYLKHSPDAAIATTGEVKWQKWWRKGLALVGQEAEAAEGVAIKASFVPRVEDGRGEPNIAPWNFLITKPAVRRPAMDWAPKEGDRFGNLTLGSLLQLNRETGMYVFRVQERPEVVLKLMKPFEGDIPDDPLEWDSLRKNKTLKRENQALKLLQGLGFIPQRIAHGYDPATGWYAIVVEFEKSRSLKNFIDRYGNRLHRHRETPADVESAVEAVVMVLNSLAIVHDKGVVHQDLKPAHVFLPPDSAKAVLIDWGLARKIDEPLSEDRRSISWLHAAPERSDINVAASASAHQDLYAVGVMLLQLAANWNLDEQPRFLMDHFSKHGRMPSATELEPMLRPPWKWAAPLIARAISSRKEVSGYAENRYTNARDMAQDIMRSYGGALTAFVSENSSPKGKS